MSLLLINANTVKPPVSPVGLEYVAEAMASAGMDVHILDLSFEPDWKAAIRKATGDELTAVGVSVRNTDDCCYATGKTFLPWIAEVVTEVKRHTAAPVILGGVGFSTAPETVMAATGADFGIHGEGENAMALLCEALARGKTGQLAALPNLIYKDGERFRKTARVPVDLAALPLPRRRAFDNPRYQREGAMVGVETKRGCDGSCIFCADPVAKGSTVRTRPPETVAREFEDLLAQGVEWFHLCDAEFNIGLDHAKEICRALVRSGAGKRAHWYTYCAPAPFDTELASLMKQAGCAGINFGADSLDDGQLARLGKSFRLADIAEAVRLMREAGINYMFDLLIGGPGETRATVQATFDGLRRLNVPLAGAAVGVRVYAGTPLWQMAARGKLGTGLKGDIADTSKPLFYVAPELGPDPMGLVGELAGGDRRFMLLGIPSAKDSYNYAGDDVLAKAIAVGARGAYWDILRRMREA